MIEVIDGFVRVKGQSHGLGKTLNLGADEEERLVSLGVAKYVDKKAKNNTEEDKKVDPNQTGTGEGEPDTGEGGPNTSLPLE